MKQPGRVANQPWSVQVELTEGCSRLCTFCGLNGIRDAPGNFRFMEVATARRLAFECSMLCPNARYEFAMHGEPLQNPNALEIFRIFRGALPTAQMQVTTNGGKLLGHMQERVDAIFAAGIDFIVLDTYYPERDKLRREAKNLVGVRVLDFYDDMHPKGMSVYANHHRKFNQTVVLMDDIGERTGEVKSRELMNHAGNSPALPIPPEPLKKTCTLPFREMSITWNGNINVCCMDWRHEYTAGNAVARTLEDIWYGPEFEAARAMLQNKNRAFGPCAKCDADSGTRAGLLPKYPPVTPETLQTVRKVEAKSPAGSNAWMTGKRKLKVVQP